MGWWIEGLTKGHRAAISARLRELPLAEQRRLLADARRATSRDWRVRVQSVMILTVVVAAFACAWAWAPRSMAVPDDPVPAVLKMATVAFWGGIVVAVWSEVTRFHLIRRHLAAAFPTLCPTCGYDRRASPARCPECGTESPAAESPPA